MPKKVIVTDYIDPQGMEILKNGAEVAYLPELPGRTLMDEVEYTHAILVRGRVKVTREAFEKARNLMIVAKHGVGYDNIDIEVATEKGIPVTNTPAANAESVIEHNLGLMLSISRNIVSADRGLRQGTVKKREIFIGTELEGKTLGVVGLGRTGIGLANKCNLALSMSIIGYDPYVPAEKVEQSGYKKVEDLDDLLKESDYVVICIPYTEETANLISARELGLMKETAFLISSARGGIVDETALYSGLVEKKIAGAALDVFTVEPPPPDNPLLSLDNFVGTPHLGGITGEAMMRMATTAADEIMRVFRGERPNYPINPQVYS